MELTHKLTKQIHDVYYAAKGSLKYRATDPPTLSSSTGNTTTTPYNLAAGDKISFITNLPIHHVHTPLIDYDTRGQQLIGICSSYTADAECTVVQIADQTDRVKLEYTATSACVVFLSSTYEDDLIGIKIKIDRKPVESTISEPIGWDNLSMRMERHDYHGIGAEVSMDMLEFYGVAYNVIKSAYDANIDSEVIYLITNGSDTIFQGQIDLTTCSFLKGDYQSVKAKIGAIGDMTIFNNRTSIDIALNEPTTVEGELMEDPTWSSLVIPKKSLLYTNKMREKSTRTIDSRGTWGGGDSAPEDITGEFVLNDVEINEYGTVSSDGVLFAKDEDFDEKFGIDTRSHLEWDISFKVSWSTFYSVGSYSVYGEVYLYSGSQLIGRSQFDMLANSSSTKTLNVHYAAQDYANNALKLSYRFWQIGDRYNKRTYSNLKLEILAGASFKMTMYDTLANDGVATKMLFVHDALSVITKAISENALSIKSDWYGYTGSVGGGAMKAITNGYNIRGLFTDGETKRNMPLSFKSIIESLDALDCIGWGFSTESGVLYIRVEKWDWFYKDTIVLTLTNVAEVTTEVYTDRIPTELKIGYKKYATQDQYNSIDSPHGTRTFVSGIKALSKALTKECEFVADNYAIEETRRARTQNNETEETTYDENIFVFELSAFKPTGSSSLYGLEITHSATNAQNVGRASEFINAKLTPRHMAARWRSFLFATNNTTPFRFTSGEINYKASFGVQPSSVPSTSGATYYLESNEESSPQVENDNISYSHAKFKAEKISFSYPLSISQYRSVKANPYGLISVNGVLGWILDFKYSLADGMADFVLIAKNS